MSPAFIAMTMTSFDADKVAMTAQLFRQISQLQLLYILNTYLHLSAIILCSFSACGFLSGQTKHFQSITKMYGSIYLVMS